MDYLSRGLFAGLICLACVVGIACTDEVGHSECPSGETFDEVTAQCVPIQCPDGSTYNPIQGQCEDDDGTPVDPVENQSNQSNDNQSNDNQSNQSNDNQSNQSNDNQSNQSNDNQSNNNQQNNTTEPPSDIDPPYDPFEPQEPSTAQYHSCESDDFEGLEEPRFIHSDPANYLLAARPDVEASAVNASVPLHGHVLEDGDANYAGFVLGLSSPDGQDSASETSDWIFGQVASIGEYGAARQGDGNSYFTHDNFPASTLNHVSLDTDDTPAEIRDRLVGAIYGIAADDLVHDLDDATASDGSGAHLVYKTVARTDEDVIVVGGITTSDLHEQPDSEARFAVQDLAGGTALAPSGETMSDECVSLEVHDTTEVDIIISLDASGSMDDVNDGLIGFADELVDLLNETDVDWRVAVTGVDCHEIRDDDALSSEFRALWPDPDEWEGGGIDFPFVPDDIDTPCKNPDFGSLPGMSDDNNGRLMGEFTTDPQEIQNQMGMVSQTGLEYTLSMGVAALDHALPRSDTDGNKLRTQAAPVVIVVTDENEQLFKDAFQDFVSGGNDPLSSSEMSELTAFIQPWLDFLNRPDLGATVSGLYWIPDTDCEGGIDVGHGIHHVVEQTGGVNDSICEPEIGEAFGEIAEATQDLITGFHLIGRPVSHTVEVDVVDLNTDQVTPMDRNIEDGFDFDTTSSSLFFEGPSAPQEQQRIVVPYLQWDGNVVLCTPDHPCPDGSECLKGSCL